MDKLVPALETRGLEVLIDRRDLPMAAEFQQELLGFIRQADTVVFVVSRASTASPWCAWEVEQVGLLGKRLAPAVIETVDDDRLPAGIRKINYVFFTGSNAEGAGFEVQADAFARALKTDLTWIKEHTRIGEHARRWEERGRAGALLLRGAELEAAEDWSAKQPLEAPPLTDLHRALIAASRHGATRRLRLLIGGSLGVALIASGLAGIAFWQWGIAQQQKELAERQKEIAENNEKRAEEERNRALVTQSRFLADLANQKAAQGRTGEAMQLALEALPDVMEARRRPFAMEAYQGLVKAFYQHDAELVLENGSVPEGGSKDGSDDVAFSADGTHLIATSTDGSATVFTLADGSPVRAWRGEEFLLTLNYAIAVASYIFTSARGEPEVQAWDATTGQRLARIKIPNTTLRSTYALLKVLGTVPGIDAKIRADFLDLTADYSLRGLTTIDHSDMALSPGNMVATSYYGGFVQLRDLASGALLRTLRVPLPVGSEAATMNSVSFNPAGTRLATTSSDATVRIWDVAQGRIVRTLQGHEGATFAAIYSRDGRFLLSAAYDSAARLWDAETGDLVGQLEVKGKVAAVAFSSDSAKVAVTSDEGTVAVWQVVAAGIEPVAKLAGHSASVSAVAFSPDGTRLATVSKDGTTRIWSVSRYRALKVMDGFKSGYAWADWHAQSKRLVAAGDGKLIHVWDMADGKKIADLGGHTATVSTLALSRNGALLVSSSVDDGNVIAWDIVAMRKLWTRKAALEGPVPRKVPLTAQSFSPDGKLILVPGENFSVQALASETGVPVRTFSGHDRTVQSAYFSEDGARMIAAAENAIRIWDAKTAQVVKTFPIERDEGSFAVLNADGKTILAHVAKAVKLLNADTGAVIQTFIGHEDPINTAVLSPDGRLLLTASGFIGRRQRRGGNDNTVRLWDVETGAPLAILRDSQGKVARADFEGATGRIIAFSVDGYIRSYPYYEGLENMLVAAKAAQRRCLTREQRQAAFLEPSPPRWCITGAGREREPQAKWDGLWPYRDRAFKDWLALTDQARSGGRPPPQLP